MELLYYKKKKTKKGLDSFFRLFNLFHILLNNSELMDPLLTFHARPIFQRFV